MDSLLELPITWQSDCAVISGAVTPGDIVNVGRLVKPSDDQGDEASPESLRNEGCPPLSRVRRTIGYNQQPQGIPFRKLQPITKTFSPL